MEHKDRAMMFLLLLNFVVSIENIRRSFCGKHPLHYDDNVASWLEGNVTREISNKSTSVSKRMLEASCPFMAFRILYPMDRPSMA